MIDARGDDRASASDFGADEFGCGLARNARAEAFAAMLMAEIVRCHRAVRRGAERCGRGARAPQNFASEIFSDHDEFHLGRDDATSRVSELRYCASFTGPQLLPPCTC